MDSYVGSDAYVSAGMVESIAKNDARGGVL